MMTRILFACALALACAACSVGQPLVEYVPDDSPDIGAMLCQRPPECTPLADVGAPERAAVPINLNRCARVGERTCPGQAQVLPPSPTMPPPPAMPGTPLPPVDPDLPAPPPAAMPTDADAGVEPPPSGEPETQPRAPGDIDPQTCVVAGSLPTTLLCREYALQPGAEGNEIVVESPNWSNVNLTIESARPLRVIWRSPHLQAVFVRLRGAVDLRILDSDEVRDLRVAGEKMGDATPRLQLDDVHGVLLSVGEEAQRFAGEVDLHLVAMSDVVLQADTIELTSVNFMKSALKASTLTIVDADFMNTSIDADSATLSAFHAQETQMRFCRETSLVNGSVIQSSIETCPDSLVRLYGSRAVGSTFDGNFETDDSTVTSTRIGVTAQTQLIAFQTTFDTVNVCSNAALLGIGVMSIMKCSDCAPDAGSHICALQQLPPPGEISSNWCPNLPPTVGPIIADCAPDLPMRTRPRSGDIR